MIQDSTDTYDQLYLKYLPEFAGFIKQHKLEEFVRYQVKIGREVDIPILKLFGNMPEDDFIEMSMISTSELLDYLHENKLEELITKTLKRWVDNELPQKIGRYEVAAKDITLISYTRKQSFLHLLPQYTLDSTLMLEIIKELDRYLSKSDTLSFQTFMNLMEERINENAHFIEKIAKTSPGILYVFDLVETKEVYSNGKTLELLGYTHNDFQRMGSNFMNELEHPDDLQKAIDHKRNFITAKDEEIRSLEHRLKDSNGNYRWIRNYESVFKRDEKGRPTQVIGIALDIENEKQMGDQLNHRQEQLLEAQGLAEMGSFTWDLATDRSEVTPQLVKILELSGQQRLGDFMNLVHPFDRPRVQEALDKAVNESGLYDCEFRYSVHGKEKILWSRGLVSFKGGKADLMKGTVTDVTDRHHMIQQLKRSEDLYKQAQALTHLGNWTWDINKNKITWTDEMYRIFGLEPQSQEITFDTLLFYLHPKDKEKFLRSVGEIKEANTNAEYFPRIILADESVKILNLKAEVLLNNDGEAYKIIGTVQDVTQQKMNEKKLRENQNFIKKIADATPSIIAAYNIHTGKYLFVNEAFEKLLGYDCKTILEEGAAFLGSLVHPDDLPVLMEKNSKALETANKQDSSDSNELIAEFIYRVRHKNGEYRWIHTYGTIFDRNEQKQVEHVLNVSIDISKRIEAENKVKEQEHFIQHIADASPSILYLFDLETQSIIYVNQEIRPVLGFSPEEIVSLGSQVASTLFHPEDIDKMEAVRKNAARENYIRQYEIRLREKNEGWRTLLVREINFKYNDAGKPTQLLCAALDITERKLMEETLNEKTIELEQSNSSLEEFAYVASHDLKEPLRKIATFGDRLLNNEQDKISATSLSYLEKIIDSSQRMQRMIDDLLSISMISGDSSFQKQSLQNILNEVIQTLEYRIEEKKAVINFDELPEAVVISSQFRQLFQNLISNSLKFSQSATPPRINIIHRILLPTQIASMLLPKAKKYLQINVSDNGIGFDDQYSEKIFSIFHRLHGRSEYEGTGIGLAICKKIVENHSGVISATGESDKGSTFIITIPMLGVANSRL